MVGKSSKLSKSRSVKSSGNDEVYILISKAKNALKHSDFHVARSKYFEALDKYSKLDHHMKKDHYISLNRLYDNLESFQKRSHAKKFKPIKIIKENPLPRDIKVSNKEKIVNKSEKGNFFKNFFSFNDSKEVNKLVNKKEVKPIKIPKISRSKQRIEKKDNTKEIDSLDSVVEMDLEQILRVIKKRWVMIASIIFLALLVGFSLSLFNAPKLYSSTSLISLGVEDDDINSIIAHKAIADSALILMPIIDEFFNENESITLDKFRSKFYNVELVEEKTSTRDSTIVPYLRITLKGKSPDEAKLMNERVVENLFNYSSTIFNKRNYFYLEEIEMKELEIVRLNEDINKIENIIHFIELIESDNADKEQRVDMLKNLVFQSFDVSIEDLNITINILDKALAEFSYRKEFSQGMVRILEFAQRYLIEQGRTYNSLSNKLLNSIKKLNEMQVERINIERELYKKEREFTVISEPPLPVGKLFQYSTESILFLKDFPDTKNEPLPSNIQRFFPESDDELSFIVESKHIFPSDKIVNPVLKGLLSQEEDLTLEEFNDQYLQVEMVSERIRNRELIVVPYLKIITKAKKPEIAKKMNEILLDGFVDDAVPQKNKDLDLITDKLNLKKQQIINLESDIVGFENELFNQTRIRFVHIADLRSLFSEFKDELGDSEIDKKDLELYYNNLNNYEIISQPQTPFSSLDRKTGLALIISLFAGIIVSIAVAISYEMD